jgi:hypothetical protein
MRNGNAYDELPYECMTRQDNWEADLVHMSTSAFGFQNI